MNYLSPIKSDACFVYLWSLFKKKARIINKSLLACCDNLCEQLSIFGSNSPVGILFCFLWLTDTLLFPLVSPVSSFSRLPYTMQSRPGTTLFSLWHPPMACAGRGPLIATCFSDPLRVWAPALVWTTGSLKSILSSLDASFFPCFFSSPWKSGFVRFISYWFLCLWPTLFSCFFSLLLYKSRTQIWKNPPWEKSRGTWSPRENI